MGSSTDGNPVLRPGAAIHLADSQGLAMAVLYWRLMGAQGLSATFTVDAGYKAFLFLLSCFLKRNDPVERCGPGR